MKRVDLIRHVSRFRCVLIREGSKHSIYLNSLSSKTSTIPRHSEIDNYLAKKICKDLGIPNNLRS